MDYFYKPLISQLAYAIKKFWI